MYFHSHTSYLLPESVSIFPLKKSSTYQNLKIWKSQRCLKILFKHPPNLIQTISVGALHQNVQQHQTRGHLAPPSNPQPLLPTNPPFQPPTPSLPLPANYEFPTGISWQRWARDPNPARGKVAKTKKIWPTSHVVHIGIITTTFNSAIFLLRVAGGGRMPWEL